MSKKHSIANKKRWAKRTKEENSRLASLVVKKRWEKTTLEERKKVGKMLADARKNAKNALK